MARDVRIDSLKPPWGIPELRRQSGWWKRLSLYSAVGVKEVKMRLVSHDKQHKVMHAVIIDFDYSSELAWYDRPKEQLLEEIKDSTDCGVDVMGRIHSVSRVCSNSHWDEIQGETYCTVERMYDLEQGKNNLIWLRGMLEYYWQNGVQDEGMIFLHKAGFITTYSNLEFDAYSDAIGPYGRPINAFLLVEGWHVRYFICLVAAGIGFSLCTIGMVTVINGSFEAGLTGGSYALGLAAVLLAALTIPSVIL